jgi:glycosyltransferase involved in cell wall biosynthesis
VDVDRLPEAMGGFDVGVAALADNAYNRGKSGVKALQYWALGVPVLASRLPMYEELAGPGLQLVDGSVEAWTEALWTACGDAGWRALHGAAGRVRLLEEWDLRRRAGDWVRVWRQVAKG